LTYKSVRLLSFIQIASIGINEQYLLCKFLTDCLLSNIVAMIWLKSLFVANWWGKIEDKDFMNAGYVIGSSANSSELIYDAICGKI